MAGKRVSKEDQIEARPKSGSKDPLAGGERLYSISSNDTAYRADRTELDAPKQKKFYQMSDPATTDKPGIPDRVAHKSKSPGKEDQLKIAKSRKE